MRHSRPHYLSNRLLHISTVAIALLAIGSAALVGIHRNRPSNAFTGHHARCDFNVAYVNGQATGTVQTNQTFQAIVKMYNDGTTTWSPNYGFGLAEYNNGTATNYWNMTGGNLGSDIPPGGTATFGLSVRAPSSPGTYPFNWALGIAYQGVVANPCTQGQVTVQSPPPAPTINIWASANPVSQNSSLAINWVSSNATNCSASGSWTGVKALSGSENRSGDTATTGTKTYYLTCSGAGGTTIQSTSVSVQAIPPPGAFSMSSSSHTTTSVVLNWGSASGAQGYYVYRGSTLIAQYGGNAITDSGLQCNTTYSYRVYAYNNGGNNVTQASNAPISVTTSACPSSGGGGGGSTPTGGGGSTPTGGSGGGSSTPTGGTGIAKITPKTLLGTGSPSAPSSAPTPPSDPSGFQATSSGSDTFVSLSWDPSPSGSLKYHLERSTDQQSWETLADGLSNNFYQDTNVQFNTHYFYRLQATDSSGLSSGFATTDVTTPAYTGNATPDSDATIVSDDKAITISIPAGALDANSQCAVSPNNDQLPPNIKDLRLVDGPFQLICKHEDGQLVLSLNKSLTVEWKLSLPKGIKSLSYYGNNNGNWYKAKLLSHNGKTQTDKFQLDQGTTFVAMGQLKKTPLIVKVLLILLIIGLPIGAGIFFLAWRRRKMAESVYDDYWHKMNGL